MANPAQGHKARARVATSQLKLTGCLPSRIFTERSFVEHITPSIRLDIDSLNLLLDDHAASGTPFDLQDVFFRFSLQSFGRIA